MIVELDLLMAIAALVLILPVPVYQLLSIGSSSYSSLAALDQSLALNSGAQRLAFQLGSLGGQQVSCAFPANATQYSLLPYGPPVNATQFRLARLVVLCGKLYYIAVVK